MSNLSNNLSKSLLNSVGALLVMGFFILSFSLATNANAQEIVNFTLATSNISTTSITFTTPQIPAPTLAINNLDEWARVAGEIIISGSALNFSQVEIYLDGSFLGTAQVEEGTTGFGTYEFTLPKILCYCEHKIEAVTKYFNNTQSTPTSFVFTYVKKFPAPTLFEPVLNSETNYARPWITGLVFNDSLIEIYLDNHLDGIIEVENSENNNVAGFRYQPSRKLDFGFHGVRAVAVNKYDLRRSTKSNEVIFEIRPYGAQQKLIAPGLVELPENFIKPVPAPTLLNPKSGTVSRESNILVAGVVKNSHLVKILVDGKFDGKFMPQDHKSGTTYFEYKIQNPFAPGVHQISAITINLRGQVSGHSNILQVLTIAGKEKVFFSPTAEIDKGASSQILGEQEQEPSPEPEVSEQEINRNWFKFLWIVIIITGLLIAFALYFERKRIKALLKKSKEKQNGEKVEIRTRGTESTPQGRSTPAGQAESTENTLNIQDQIKKGDFENDIPKPPPDAPDNNGLFGF